jgi:hypothetical protein
MIWDKLNTVISSTRNTESDIKRLKTKHQENFNINELPASIIKFIAEAYILPLQES